MALKSTTGCFVKRFLIPTAILLKASKMLADRWETGSASTEAKEGSGVVTITTTRNRTMKVRAMWK